MSGLLGIILRFIGPLVIVPNIALIGFALLHVAALYASKNWYIALAWVLSYNCLIKLDCAQRTQTSAKACNLSRSDPGFEFRLRINPDSDPDVCQIAPMLWFHHLVGVSHFAECRENQLVTDRLHEQELSYPNRSRVSCAHNTSMVFTLCSKKHVTTFLMISWSRTVRLQRFLAHLLPRVYAIDRYI